MRLANFTRILLLAFALAGYSAWAVSVREQAGRLPVGEAGKDGIPLVRLDEAEALWKQGATVFVDVRSAEDYEAGHIPGAILLPETEFEKVFPALRPRLERAEDIVVYCGGMTCSKSLWSAIRLRNEGLKQTKIYPAGWNEWFTRDRPAAHGRQ